MKATKLLVALAALSCVTLCAVSVAALALPNVIPPLSALQDKKVMQEFRGVRLGMKRDQVVAALGKPQSPGDTREDFSFDGDNQATIHYENGEVRAIQISFVNQNKIPGWTEVVGDAEVNQMENGAKFARKVVAAEHFWVSMYQSKDGSVTRITISR